MAFSVSFIQISNQR